MNNLSKYIIEKLIINKDIREPSIYDKPDIKVFSNKSSKPLVVKMYADDKESLHEFGKQYEIFSRHNLLKYNRIYIAKKQYDHWVADARYSYEMNTYQPNDKYLYVYPNKSKHTFNELVEMIESGDYLVVMVSK